jgi:hypothetical protein
LLLSGLLYVPFDITTSTIELEAFGGGN